jgi:predicted nucleotidyltransferase
MNKIIESIKNSTTLFCNIYPNIIAVLLVGSYARNEQKEGSDIDLVIITEDKEKFFLEDKWIKIFGKPMENTVEEWGEIKSIRIKYSEYEIEFGIGTRKWIRIPLDKGTEKVLRNGYIILFEKENCMEDIKKLVEEKDELKRT